MSKTTNSGFNVSSFVKGSDDFMDPSIKQEIVVETVHAPKKRSSGKKNEIKVVQTEPTTIVPQNSMSYIQENIPYTNAYLETNSQLDSVINELTMLERDTMGDLQMVRASKTLKNKFGYITNMTENAVGILNAKITAIKEKNKTIGDVNNLEIRRIKELKIQASEEDDNTRIANLYNAFVNTPIGMGTGVLGPSVQETMMVGGTPDLTRASIGGDQIAWEQNLNPAESRMVLEAKGVIDTVVMYDESTGNRWFEVVDKNTRQPIPGVEKPDSSYIYDLDINVRGGFAKDGNRNTIYPLVVINNGNTSITEY